MRKSPRLIAVVAGCIAALIILPPTFAMDIMERIVSTQTGMIRREATEYQRKVAEANARAYMAKRLVAYRHSTAKAEAAPPKPHSAAEAQEVRAMKKKLPRYIAVDAPKDKRSAPGTKKDVMIWDTQSETFAGNYVYDVANPPSVGAKAKFDTYSAEYVSNGL